MSFMDRKNILTEGFFDMLKKLLNRPKLSSKDKLLMKDPEFKKAYDDWKKSSEKTKKALASTLKKQGIKSRFK